MHALSLAAALALALAAAPRAAQTTPPAPPADMAAMNKVQVIDIRVSDASGVPIPSAAIRWRALGSSTPPAPASSGTAGTIKGQFPPELPPQVFTPEVYTQRLLDRAAEVARERTMEVRVVGAPVVMPEVVRIAARPSSPLPEAVAVTAVYEKGTFSDVGLVMFRGDTMNSRLSNTDGAFEQMDEREWRDMTAVLDGFFADAVDVTRGPERFASYLPGNMRQMLDLRDEKNRIWLRPDAVAALSHDQLRRFVSLVFDHAVLMVWSEVSGVPWSSGFTPNQIRRDPLAAIAALETSTAAARTALADAGAVTPERIAAPQLYVRRLLGDGYIVRENPNRDGIRLPRGTRMYTVMLGGPLPHVIVEKGKVRVVAVDYF